MDALGYLAAYRGLVAAHAPDGPVRLLDAGCGAGDFAASWRAERGEPASLTLLDPSPGMIAKAMARHDTGSLRPLALVAKLDDLPPCPQYDVILCAHVIEHLDAPLHGLHRMRAALAPGGRILLVASKPHWCNRLIWLRWQHRSLPPARVRALVAGAGLIVRDDHGFPNGPPRRTSHAYHITHT
jgi:ubiquinone/menaquinone biosynthesis C-methylase UbiE